MTPSVKNTAPIAVVERDRLLGIDLVRLDAQGSRWARLRATTMPLCPQQAGRVMPGAGVSQRSLDRVEDAVERGHEVAGLPRVLAREVGVEVREQLARRSGGMG